MKAILLFAKDSTAIAPVKMSDFAQLGTGQAIAAPGVTAHVLTTTGRLVPANVNLIRARS